MSFLARTIAGNLKSSPKISDAKSGHFRVFCELKHFPEPEKYTRKEPQNVFGPDKLSKILRFAFQERHEKAIQRVLVCFYFWLEFQNSSE